MMPDENILIDCDDLYEIDPEAEDLQAGFEATSEPVETARMQFSVQMGGYQMEQFETVIIEACAAKIVRGMNASKLDKMIEERCIALVTARIDERMRELTKEIVNQPVIVPTHHKGEAVTIAEFIGLAGRDYLAARVDSEGKPASSSGWGSSATTRAEWLINRVLDSDFKREIEKAKNELASQARKSVKTAMDSFLAEKRAEVAAAIAKLTA